VLTILAVNVICRAPSQNSFIKTQISLARVKLCTKCGDIWSPLAISCPLERVERQLDRDDTKRDAADISKEIDQNLAGERFGPV
jgi:hypothetical protein